jgi:G:T-mismatch repair DNA endonuclease (very short patch repair protein)
MDVFGIGILDAQRRQIQRIIGSFWQKKFDINIKRDTEERKQLESMGVACNYSLGVRDIK